MKRALLAVLLVTAGLAGCIGSDDAPAEPAAASDTDNLNPWQRGLDEDYPTPDVAERRSADERRADVAEPRHPEFAAFDARMTSWMEQHNISAGQLAIMKDGQLRYERGYGHVDRAETRSANESTMFRVASVTKPMTKALVHLQVEQGLYNWTDPVFCLGEDPAPDCRLPIAPHPSNPVEDSRIEDITVRQLLEHNAGWSSSATWLELSPGPIHVAEEIGVDSPPPSWRVGQYLMGEPLEYAPGEVEAWEDYCNICYMVAGLVAEAATGADLGALYEAYLFEPLGVAGEIEAGYTLPEDRNPREPFYPCEPGGDTRRPPDVYHLNETACWPEGGLVMEDISLGLGGVVGTASAVAAVYEAYATEVLPESNCGGTPCYWHTGSFPGSRSASLVTFVEGGSTAQFVYSFNAKEPGEHCDGTLADEGGPLAAFAAGCTWDHLFGSMLLLTGAWAEADEQKPSSIEDALPAGQAIGVDELLPTEISAFAWSR